MSPSQEFRDLVAPEDVEQLLREFHFAGGTETVALSEASGRTLAERVDAGIDVPGFDRAAMDGYALRARDTFGASEQNPVSLSVVGSVAAGTQPEATVEAGEAVEIATGAVMPSGANAVVPVERTTVDEGVTLRTTVAPGDDVMAAGADVAAGERCVGAGTVLTPREIGVLAALGAESLPVRAKPTVGVLSIGAELVAPGAALDHSAGEIHDVNAATVAAAVEDAGGDAVCYPRVPDDAEAVGNSLERAASECDLVVSSGSTSVSEHDVVGSVVAELGTVLVHGVAIKPGKPTILGRLDSTPFVGLPGYPVSALSIFRRFLAPALRRAAGRRATSTPTQTGALAERVRYPEGRHRLLPVGLVESGSGETLVYPVDTGSGATTSLADADGIVEMAADTALLQSGERVRVEQFSGARPPALFGVGERDPILFDLLDSLDAERYLAVGSSEGARRLARGTPDFAVVASPVEAEAGTELAAWQREWGIAVEAGNPLELTGPADLESPERQFCTRHRDSALRAAFEAVNPDADGYAVRGSKSPLHRLMAGDADAGLCLRIHAAAEPVEFLPIDTQRVSLRCNDARLEKPAVRALRAALEELESDSSISFHPPAVTDLS